MKRIKKALMAVMMCCGLASCYKEDMSLCVPGNASVHLTLRLADDVVTRTAMDLSDFDIAGARVWAFDSSGRTAAGFTVGYKSDGMYDIFMSLPPDRYDFVVWMGNGNTYKIASGVDDMEAMELLLDHDKHVLTDNIPDLLHGMVRGCTVVSGADNDIEMVMHPNTCGINITAQGLSRFASDTWEISITADNIRYTFDNSIVHGAGELQHLRQGELTGIGRLHTFIKTLTITPERHMQLTLRNVSTGEIFYDESLAKTIIDTYAANGRTVDFDHVYNYDIELMFSDSPVNADMTLTVRVNDWEYVPQPTELQ